MKNLYVLSILVLTVVSNLHAQFSGGYAPAKWSVSSAPGNGSVNSSGAPASITVNGSDAGSGNDINTNYTITAIASGIWSFHWVYHTNDGDPSFDHAGITVNGSFIKLTNDVGANDQSGNYTAAYVTAGTVIGFRVEATDDFGGNASLSISSFSPPGGVLPVKLSSFTATEQNSKVQLRWNVGEEINTASYQVQHSVDGVQFTGISTVPSRHLPQYTVTDNHPVSGINYYRLQIADNDGSTTYSQLVSVKLNTLSNLSLYPNPFHDKLSVEITLPGTKEEVVGIYDASGRRVYHQHLNLPEGPNRIQLNLSSLYRGIYFIRFEKSGLSATISKP